MPPTGRFTKTDFLFGNTITNTSTTLGTVRTEKFKRGVYKKHAVLPRKKT